MVFAQPTATAYGVCFLVTIATIPTFISILAHVPSLEPALDKLCDILRAQRAVLDAGLRVIHNTYPTQAKFVNSSRAASHSGGSTLEQCSDDRRVVLEPW